MDREHCCQLRLAQNLLQDLQVVGSPNFQQCKDATVELLENSNVLETMGRARGSTLQCHILGACSIGKSVCLALTVQDLLLTIERTQLLKGKVR